MAGGRMTEERWLDGATSQAMLRCVRTRTSERKLRLFAVAVCREYKRLVPRFDDPEGRRAILLAEEFAERGEWVDDPVRYAHGGAFVLNPSGYGAASRLVGVEDVPESYKCGLARCVFGNPFRPVNFDPAWLAPTAVDLARTIYEERAFDRMPELAEALQQAGCHDAGILGHCQGPGPHAKGCWVVDLILGKE